MIVFIFTCKEIKNAVIFFLKFPSIFWKNQNFEFFLNLILGNIFFKLSTYSKYECFQIISKKLAIKASGNAAKNFEHLLRLLWRKLTPPPPSPCVTGDIFPDSLSNWILWRKT